MDKIIEILQSMERRIEALERQATINTITFPSDGKLVVPSMTSDPASPTDGELWYRSDTDVYKVRQNGVTKTITTA